MQADDQGPGDGEQRTVESTAVQTLFQPTEAEGAIVSDFNEADLVCALESGEKEVDVTAQYGITFEKLDEIMEAHDVSKCSKCKTWHFTGDGEGCLECGGE